MRSGWTSTSMHTFPLPTLSRGVLRRQFFGITSPDPEPRRSEFPILRAQRGAGPLNEDAG
jgi:hypothetical protein